MKQTSMLDEFLREPKTFFFLREIHKEFHWLNYKTARTWALRGIKLNRSAKSPRIKLRTFRRGATLMTTNKAVVDFLAATDGMRN